MSFKNLTVQKKNVTIYDRQLPHILMENEDYLIVRVGIPVCEYNKCKEKIRRGKYLRDTPVSRIMHIKGLFMKYVNAALGSLNLHTNYMAGNVIGITTGDSSVFSNECYVVPYHVVIDRDHKTSTITIDDQDVQHVRIIDYIVPIDNKETELDTDNVINSIKYNNRY